MPGWESPGGRFPRAARIIAIRPVPSRPTAKGKQVHRRAVHPLHVVHKYQHAAGGFGVFGQQLKQAGSGQEPA